MNLSVYIARRYFFSKKSHNAINVISFISICGIAIATLAMVCTLSIFNGFTKIAAGSFSLMDPDLQIIPSSGKVFDPNTSQIKEIKSFSEIEFFSEVIEENALAKYGGRQEPVLVKGVSSDYQNVSQIDQIMFDGEFILHQGDVYFCVAGIGIASKLGLRADNINAVELFSPKRDVKVNLANPSQAFSHVYAYPAGVFTLRQTKYDDRMIIVPIELARQLFRYNTQISTLEIKLKDPNKTLSLEQKIQTLLGDQFIVKNRLEQQADSFRMVNIEKWVTYLILAFILILAVFNVVSSLSMLILDKEEDINILRKLGANNQLITRIFLFEGWLISFSGAISGIILGIIICLLQEHFGFIRLGNAPGTFIIDSYPISIAISDIFFIFITASIIGFLIVLYPVKNLKNKLDTFK